jgi:hypothetical protein
MASDEAGQSWHLRCVFAVRMHQAHRSVHRHKAQQCWAASDATSAKPRTAQRDREPAPIRKQLPPICMRAATRARQEHGTCCSAARSLIEGQDGVRMTRRVAPGGIPAGMPKGIPGGGSIAMPDCAGISDVAAMPPLPPSKCTVVVPVADCDRTGGPMSDGALFGEIFSTGQHAGRLGAGQGRQDAPTSQRHRQ